MKKLITFFLILFIFSCAHKQPIVIEDDKEEIFDIVEIQEDIEVEKDNKEEIVFQFENVFITKETFETTKSELEKVVEKLNLITLKKDYQAWLGYLSEEYISNFSDPIILSQLSKNLPVKNITLKTLRDYFYYVFVPSRQNMRVDDIQFVTPIRVYVIMDIMENSPAAIYIIEKQNDGWKLVPKNQ